MHAVLGDGAMGCHASCAVSDCSLFWLHFGSTFTQFLLGSPLNHRKRPVYWLADDDGFVYTGDSDEPVYTHGKHDVQVRIWVYFHRSYTEFCLILP